MNNTEIHGEDGRVKKCSNCKGWDLENGDIVTTDSEGRCSECGSTRPEKIMDKSWEEQWDELVYDYHIRGCNPGSKFNFVCEDRREELKRFISNLLIEEKKKLSRRIKNISKDNLIEVTDRLGRRKYAVEIKVLSKLLEE